MAMAITTNFVLSNSKGRALVMGLIIILSLEWPPRTSPEEWVDGWSVTLTVFSSEWPPHTSPEEGMDGVYDHGHLSSSAMSPISLSFER